MNAPKPVLTDEVIAFCTTPFIGTDLTMMDVFKIGESLLNTVAATLTLGHSSPASNLDYTRDTGMLWTDVVRDYTAWTSGRLALAPGADDRLRALVGEGGWQRKALNEAAGRLQPALAPKQETDAA